MRSFEKIADLQPLVGESLGTSEWLTVDQHRVNLFAEVTEDHQWIHVDEARAKAGPFGGTIVHGFLTLSLLPAFTARTFRIGETKSGLNYGLDKVRFVSPALVGKRLRAHFRLLEWTAINNGGAQLKIEMTVECEGLEKPVCIAESILRLFP